MGPALALAAALPCGMPAAAALRQPEESVAAAYVRARAAEIVGEPETAAAGYAAALAATPGDTLLAGRAYGQAIVAGDHPLASRAAAILEARGALSPDGTLLLFGDAVAAADWPRARALADRVEREQLFSFMAPIMRAWIAFGAKDGDPLAKLAAPPRSIGAPYVAEHRALLLLATGRIEDAIAAVRSLAASSGDIAIRLRAATAASLAAGGRKDSALAFLQGDGPGIEAARALVVKGRPLPGAVDDPAAGIAELYLRVSGDIDRERVTPLALSLARFASFLAPRSAEAWLDTAQMLAASDHYPQALIAVNQVAAGDPLASDASGLRVRLRVHLGDREGALGEALAAAKRKDADLTDWTRVGDLYADLGRQRDAADAYDRAIALAQADPRAASTVWTLWLRKGGALEQAGDWTNAKAALAKSVALAPEEPAALNYLGYAELERRENLPQAEALIAKASALQPDDSAITDSLGWSYYVRGDIPRAIATLERAVAAEPGETEMNEHLGDAYWAAGRRIEARAAWSAALAYADDQDGVRLRAKIGNGLPLPTP